MWNHLSHPRLPQVITLWKEEPALSNLTELTKVEVAFSSLLTNLINPPAGSRGSTDACIAAGNLGWGPRKGTQGESTARYRPG